MESKQALNSKSHKDHAGSKTNTTKSLLVNLRSFLKILFFREKIKMLRRSCNTPRFGEAATVTLDVHLHVCTRECE